MESAVADKTSQYVLCKGVIMTWEQGLFVAFMVFALCIVPSIVMFLPVQAEKLGKR